MSVFCRVVFIFSYTLISEIYKVSLFSYHVEFKVVLLCIKLLEIEEVSTCLGNYHLGLPIHLNNLRIINRETAILDQPS